MNVVIWAVLNFLLLLVLLFYEKISHAPKSTKKHQKAQKAPKAQKAQKRNKAKAQKRN